MTCKPKPTVTLSKIIRDPRDATRDYLIPADKAKALYDAGLLHYDGTNGYYCTPRPSDKRIGMDD
jgi:hypothetical protein